MNADSINFDLYALTKPKSLEDVIALADEAIAEMRRIQGYFASITADQECPIDA